IHHTLPKSVVARDLGMNNTRFTRLMQNVEQFKLEELFFVEINNFIHGIANCDTSKTNLMAEVIKSMTLVEEAIISKIYLIRGQKVMIDRDLAQLYGAETQ